MIINSIHVTAQSATTQNKTKQIKTNQKTQNKNILFINFY
jgi:hypothetical protein